MREFKFRAWDKEKKQMLDMNDLRPQMWVYDGDFEDLFDGIQEDCELMQYSGIKDKNKKESYEDDLIFVGEKADIYQICLVGGCFIVRDIRAELERYDDVDYEDNCYHNELLKDVYFEIIGNIHENPELLKTL